VASYEVLAVRYATLASSRGALFHGYSAYGEPDAEQRLDYYLYVLRGEGRTIVVDAGFEPAVGRRRGRELLCEPLDALGGLGIDPGAVETLILTHFHYDHVGNVAAFDRAEVLAPARELEFWTGPLASRQQFAAHVEAAEIDALAELRRGGRLHTYAGPATLAPGVEAIHVGGHSPGQHLLVIAGERGRVVLASDAAHLREELERERPFAIFVDLAEMYRGYELIRGIAATAPSLVVPGHEPGLAAEFERLPGQPALRIA
jgi:glyoxylase-like metal-dependent hydrolase (beta-lactamase superfamily II)